VVFWKIHPGTPTDSFTYYLAGQRLNTGGQIYDLRPSDFWPAGGPPLYGPPLVAVIWRPWRRSVASGGYCCGSWGLIS
jgi:hypothetical protein